VNSSERWRLWAQRCVDIRTLASTLAAAGHPSDQHLRVLRDRLPSLLDAMIDEVRSLEHKADLLGRMLEEQTAQRQELLQHVPVACILTDGHGQITDANREAALLFNISARSLVGRPVELFVLNRAEVERATAHVSQIGGYLHLKVVVKPREKDAVPASIKIQRAAAATPLWRWFFLPPAA
jgi:PAS domain S-box-containing protein